MTMPVGVVPASVVTMAPWMVASSGNSWNHMPGSTRGRILCCHGGPVGPHCCVASKMFPRVSLQGQAQIQRYWMRGVEGHVQGPLLGCRAPVGQAPSRVHEVCHYLRWELYPRLQRPGGRNGKHRVLCLEHPLPTVVPWRRLVPYHGGALCATSLKLWECGHSQVLLEACM